jgi:hypothetical protein
MEDNLKKDNATKNKFKVEKNDVFENGRQPQFKTKTRQPQFFGK